MKFHEGEIAVQARAGVRIEADRLAAVIPGSIPPERHAFLSARRMAVLGTADAAGRVWASVVTGDRGLITPVDEHVVRVAARISPGDPLFDNLAEPCQAAMIVPDFATQRRLRLNGKAHIVSGAIEIRTEQVYGNCSHYIQVRTPAGEHQWEAGAKSVRFNEFSDEHQRLIAAADTFFIASVHPGSGADISHRGGNPGFVRVAGARRLVIPDYSGNNMFNTLGNIAVNPRVGLLFIDFENGRTLQLTGRAVIDWGPGRAKEMAGAARVLDFELDELIDNPQGFALRFTFREYSHFNPS
jgi:predicted pyridoxine 5'-phosphate oxidase superfamily flavin-nucleotide-binding protein